ncbi:MAG: alpha/beta hydrolase-fold protein [Planctomycetia bacterium]
MKRYAILLFGLLLATGNYSFSRALDADKDFSQGLQWVTPEVKAPRVSFHTFESKAVKGKVSYHLYRPACYDQDKLQKLPVVYWLHGSGGGLSGIPKIANYFNEAIESGKAPPCLVVFVNGLVEGMYVNWKDGSAPLETLIIQDLLPHVDSSYRTIPAREARLLDGFSMGGYGAARLGFKYPELFRTVSIMGAGPLQAELIKAPRASRQRALDILKKVYGGDQEYFKSSSPRRLAEENKEVLAKGSLIRQVCGDKDETFGNNREFHEVLERLKIPHTWKVLNGVDHNPMRTLEALGDSNWAFYRKAFQKESVGEGPGRSPDFELSFKVKDKERRAMVVNAPSGDQKRPAVIVLHGGMGSARLMRANSGFDSLAKSEGFMLVYAEGTDFGEDRHAWNTGYLLRHLVRDADDIAYLDLLLDRLVAQHGADPARIYMTGGSNGGMMTFVYAVARAQRLAAIAPVVASMFTFDASPSVPLPILIINGAKDDEVPLEGGLSRNPIVRKSQQAPFKPLEEVVEFWVKANKSRVQPETKTQGTAKRRSYAATPMGAATEFLVDSAGGHGWPGTKSRREGNTPIMSFSAAEVIWDFFKDKERK